MLLSKFKEVHEYKMMIFLNNLVPVFYDLGLITFLALFLNFIIFMDYELQADPHKNKIENFKIIISNNIKRYVVIVSIVVFSLKCYALKNAFLESLHQCLHQYMIRASM